MSGPRIEVDLHKIRHNTRTLVGRLRSRGIRTTAVTKAVCGHPSIARAMLDSGAAGLAEARLRNVQRLRKARIKCPITLIRTPMLSQANDVVKDCETSYNTEMAVIALLAAAAIRQNKVHGIILMVEMGDLREGIMPQDLAGIAQQVVNMPGVALKGIGDNFACLHGIVPTAAKMQAVSDLATDVERQCGRFLLTVSGGNSANLPWAFAGQANGRINDLRIGEAILLGVDPITGDQIGGMFHDAFTLVAEIIEKKSVISYPHLNVFDPTLASFLLASTTQETTQLILAIGRQDTDIAGLSMPPGHTLIGATSDHLVIGAKHTALCVGSEMRFQMSYGALMRAMAAPDVEVELLRDRRLSNVRAKYGPDKHVELA